MRTEDDEALISAERTSTVIMVVILVGLLLMPDVFGCAAVSDPRPTSVEQR